ncbi:MAG: STAS domain-containing protein [Ignavibacteria bacterium]|nr:STAS domain-containing protein [Ignavibacteria bacterium]
MLKFEVNKTEKYTTLILYGRIDGQTAPELDILFDRLTKEGGRIIAVDFSNVNYLSSAGIGVFVKVQKILKNISGEIILLSVSDNLYKIFSVSGLVNFFKIYRTEIEWKNVPAVENECGNLMTVENENIKISYVKLNDEVYGLSVLGTMTKIENSSYSESDVVTVLKDDLDYALGVAVMGDDYREYKMLFGESVVLDNNFFSYPAVKNPYVDYMLDSQSDDTANYKFLTGFGFKGNFSAECCFQAINEFVTLDELVTSVPCVSDSPVFGIALLAESAGLYTMNIKKVPVIDNKPLSGNIFDKDKFNEWFDYSIEYEFKNNVVACAGVIVRNPTKLKNKSLTAYAKNLNYHFHAAIFNAGLLCKKIGSYKNELHRIISNFNICKVQHLIGKSRLKNGLFGIVNLEEE